MTDRRSVTLVMHLPRDQVSRLDALATRLSSSRTALLRQAVDQYLRSQEAQTPHTPTEEGTAK